MLPKPNPPLDNKCLTGQFYRQRYTKKRHHFRVSSILQMLVVKARSSIGSAKALKGQALCTSQQNKRCCGSWALFCAFAAFVSTSVFAMPHPADTIVQAEDGFSFQRKAVIEANQIGLRQASSSVVDYEFSVPTAGRYTFSIHLSARGAGERLLEINKNIPGSSSTNLSSVLAPGPTSLQDYRTANSPSFQLAEGKHSFRFFSRLSGEADFNIDWIRLNTVDTQTPDPAPTTPPNAVNTLVQAEKGFSSQRNATIAAGHIGLRHSERSVADYTFFVPKAGSFRLSARVSSQGTGNRFLRVDKNVPGSSSVFINRFLVQGPKSLQDYVTAETGTFQLAAGTQSLRLYSEKGGDADFNIDWIKLNDVTTQAPDPNPTPSPGSSITVPAKIQAEAFTRQSGTQTEPTTDTGGGLNVGYTNNGDYLEYQIRVPESGTYKLDFRVATPISGVAIDIIGGEVLLESSIGKLNVPNTGGWQNWQTRSAQVNLQQGEQTLRFAFLGQGNGLVNLNWVDVSLVTAEPAPGEFVTLPAKLEAEDLVRQRGVQTQSTTDTGGGQHIGFIQNGDYIEFDVATTATGTYQMDFRVAAPAGAGGAIDILAGGNVVGNISIPSTGGWQTFDTVRANVDLQQASQSLRFAFRGTANYLFNLNWIDVTEVSSASPDPVSAVTIPAKIEAEDYTAKSGMRAETTGDVGGGSNMGYIQNGNYAEYIISVPSAGAYQLDARVAAVNAGSSINISSLGVNLGTIDVPVTGNWQSYQTRGTRISLPAGNQVLRITASGDAAFGLFNLNWIRLSNVAAAPPGTIGVPARIEAEAYKRQSGTQKESTGTSSGGEQVAHIRSGDFIEFDLFVPRTAAYTLRAGVSTATSGGQIRIFANNTQLGTLNVANTGGWTKYTTVEETGLRLSAGINTLRLNFVGGAGFLFNIDWLELIETDVGGSGPAPVTNPLLGAKPRDIIDILGYGDNFPNSTAVSFRADQFSNTGSVLVNGEVVAPFSNSADNSSISASNHAGIVSLFNDGLGNSGLGANNGALMRRFVQLNPEGFNAFVEGGVTGNFFNVQPFTDPNNAYATVPYAPNNNGNLITVTLDFLSGGVLGANTQRVPGQLPDSMMLAAVWEGLNKSGPGGSLISDSTEWFQARLKNKAETSTYANTGTRQFGELGAIWYTISEGNIPEDKKDLLRQAYAGSMKYFDDNFASLLDASPVGAPTGPSETYVMSAVDWQATADVPNSGSPQAANDGRSTTAWSMPGKGVWLEADLGEIREITGVDLTFWASVQRTYTFDIDVSDNGTTWRPVLTKETSANNTSGAQAFRFAGRQARYVRFIGHGNSVNNLNTLSEITIAFAPLDNTPTFTQGPIIDSNITASGQDNIQKFARAYRDPNLNALNRATASLTAYLGTKRDEIYRLVQARLDQMAGELFSLSNAPINSLIDYPAATTARQAVDPRQRSNFRQRFGWTSFASINADLYISADKALGGAVNMLVENMFNYGNNDALNAFASLGDDSVPLAPHFDVRVYFPIRDIVTGKVNSAIQGTSVGNASIDLNKGDFLMGIRASAVVAQNWFGSAAVGFGGVDIITSWSNGQLVEIRVAPTIEGVAVAAPGAFPRFVATDESVRGEIRQALDASALLLDRLAPKPVQVLSASSNAFHWVRSSDGSFDAIPDFVTVQGISATGLTYGLPEIGLFPNIDVDVVGVLGIVGGIAYTQDGINRMNDWADGRAGRVRPAPTPGVPGQPQGDPLPGRLQAEDHSLQFGIQTQSTTDVGGGKLVGFIENDDYIAFEVDVASPGNYQIQFRVASDTAGGFIDIVEGGANIGSVEVGFTGGWQSWTTVSTEVNLKAGPQTLRFEFRGPNGYLFNVNWIDVVAPVTP